MLWCLIIAALVLGFVFYVTSRKNPVREGFGDVLGSAGPYKDVYYKCLSDCEKEDSRLRMGPNNLYCGMACDTHISEIAKAQPFPIPQPVTEQDVCEKKCGSNGQCVADCTCYREIEKFCAMECRYSPSRKETCHDECFMSRVTDCSSGSWAYKG